MSNREQTGLLACRNRRRTVVCHVASGHPWWDPRIFGREAVSLARAGYEVHVVGGTDTASDQAHRRDGVWMHPALWPRGGRIQKLIGHGWKVLKAAMKTKAEIYHVHEPVLMLAGIWLKFALRRKVILDVHEDNALLLKRDYLPKPVLALASWVLGGLERFCAKRFDALITVTEPLGRKFRPFARRVAVLHNFPSDEFFQQARKAWRNPENRPYDLVHLGTLRRERVEQLIRVDEALVADGRSYRWLFIGVPEELAQFMRQRLGDSAQRFEILGKVKHEEVAELVAGAKVGVNFHRLDEPHLWVAIPLKLFEYMACGLPVVSTALPEVVRLLGEEPSARLVSHEVDEYAAAVREMVEHPDRDRLSRRAREAAIARFSWASEERKLLALYDEVVSE